MIENIKRLHKEVHDHLVQTTNPYKKTAYKSRRHANFFEGDLVIHHKKTYSQQALTTSKKTNS